MSNRWNPAELDAIAAAEELGIASWRPDGTLRPYTAIWVVAVGEDLYVRSARGRVGGWFRRAAASQQGRIRAGGIERDVSFAEPGDDDQRAIDDAYRSKYARYAAAYVDPIVSPAAAAATLRLEPR
jgi:hypothetical protein